MQTRKSKFNPNKIRIGRARPRLNPVLNKANHAEVKTSGVNSSSGGQVLIRDSDSNGGFQIAVIPDHYRIGNSRHLVRVRDSDSNGSFQIAVINFCPCNKGFRHNPSHCDRCEFIRKKT